MLRVAVVLSAGSYVGELNALPACGNDAESIVRIVKNKGRFDNIIAIHDEKSTLSAKEKLFAFLASFEGKNVDELLFYFSGHGEFFEEEFYYLMCDYKSSKRRQTSIFNSDLDDAVRRIKPRLYAKIVDACQSGISYVKDTNNISIFLEKSKPRLENIYSLFSSHSDESSWQSNQISYFTASIISAVIRHEKDSIKYRDIINFISDDFESSGIQKPFFVNQGPYTDTFCEITDSLRGDLAKFLKSEPPTALVEARKNSTLIELVRAEAEAYCNEEEVKAVVGSLEESFGKFELDKDFKDMFSIQISRTKINSIPDPAAIGTWLNQKKDEKRYFAEPSQVKERIEEDQLARAIKVVSLSGKFDPDYRYVIKGYKNNADLPFQALAIEANNMYPNLFQAICYVAPIVSRTHVRVFYTYVRYEEEDWVTRRLVGRTDWQSEECGLKDRQAIERIVVQILRGFAEYIQNPIRERFSID